MKITFEDCLSKKKIFRFEQAKNLVAVELEDAKIDLESAEKDLGGSNFKWATIKGYYSMFHSGRALLYSRGYRERGHYCLYLALKKFFADEGKIEPKIIEDFYNSMIVREDADYHRKFSQQKAKLVITSAAKFLSTAKDLLLTKNG